VQSIGDRIEQLRTNPSFQAYFPEPPSGDEEQIRENLDRIASGEVQVVK